MPPNHMQTEVAALRQEIADLKAKNVALLAACKAVGSQLEYLRNIWGDEGITRSVADAVKAAITASETP